MKQQDERTEIELSVPTISDVYGASSILPHIHKKKKHKKNEDKKSSGTDLSNNVSGPVEIEISTSDSFDVNSISNVISHRHKKKKQKKDDENKSNSTGMLSEFNEPVEIFDKQEENTEIQLSAPIISNINSVSNNTPRKHKKKKHKKSEDKKSNGTDLSNDVSGPVEIEISSSDSFDVNGISKVIPHRHKKKKQKKDDENKSNSTGILSEFNEPVEIFDKREENTEIQLSAPIISNINSVSNNIPQKHKKKKHKKNEDKKSNGTDLSNGASEVVEIFDQQNKNDTQIEISSASFDVNSISNITPHRHKMKKRKRDDENESNSTGISNEFYESHLKTKKHKKDEESIDAILRNDRIRKDPKDGNPSEDITNCDDGSKKKKCKIKNKKSEVEFDEQKQHDRHLYCKDSPISHGDFVKNFDSQCKKNDKHNTKDTSIVINVSDESHSVGECLSASKTDSLKALWESETRKKRKKNHENDYCDAAYAVSNNSESVCSDKKKRKIEEKIQNKAALNVNFDHCESLEANSCGEKDKKRKFNSLNNVETGNFTDKVQTLSKNSNCDINSIIDDSNNASREKSKKKQNKAYCSIYSSDSELSSGLDSLNSTDYSNREPEDSSPHSHEEIDSVRRDFALDCFHETSCRPGSVEELECDSGRCRNSTSSDESFDQAAAELSKKGSLERELFKKWNLERERSKKLYDHMLHSDFNNDPVPFEIPPLHSCETVHPITQQQKDDMAARGVAIKSGTYTKAEDEIIKGNFEDFVEKFSISDPVWLLGLGRRSKDLEFEKFVKAKHFYVRLAKGLNNRPLSSVYRRARKILNRDSGRLNDNEIENVKKLRNMLDQKWHLIGDTIGKTAHRCFNAHRWHSKKVAKGKFTAEEEEQLVEAIKKVTGCSDISCKTLKMVNWEIVASHIPTRNFSQCRWHWALHLAWAPNSARKKWNRSCFNKLIQVLSKSWNVEDASMIDWDKLHETFEDVAPSPVYLQKQWLYLRRKVPNYSNKSYRDILRLLRNMHIARMGKDSDDADL